MTYHRDVCAYIVPNKWGFWTVDDFGNLVKSSDNQFQIYYANGVV